MPAHTKRALLSSAQTYMVANAMVMQGLPYNVTTQMQSRVKPNSPAGGNPAHDAAEACWYA